jgi:hypothetical protein
MISRGWIISHRCSWITVVWMISWGWIISHKCSWITVYVLCYNAQINLIVIFMSCTCIVMHSLFCQLPNCNLFTQHVISLWRDTSSELWTPVHSFTFILPSTASTAYFPQILFYFTTNKHHLPHCTFNPLFSANQWDWQLHCKLGQSILVVLCAGSMLLLAPTPRHQLSSGAS